MALFRQSDMLCVASLPLLQQAHRVLLLLYNTHTQVTSAPGKWLSTSVSLQNGSSPAGSPLLEFVVTDGGSQWDKPAQGGCVCVCWTAMLLVLVLLLQCEGLV